MKHAFILLFTLVFISCSHTKLDIEEARECAEGYLTAVQESNFKKASTYYSDMYNETESPELRIEKMQKLEEVMGKMISFDLIESEHEKKPGEFMETVKLTYKVEHANVGATQRFVLMKDKGKCKIVGQHVATDNF
jgi:hypothetical protein